MQSKPNPPNPFAYRKPITLDTLGDLFSHHRRLSGGWSMGPEDPPANPPKNDPPTFEPIISQEDFDRRLGERLSRERSKYADYDDLKDKAAKYDEGVKANQSEHEKALEVARTEGETKAQQAANSRIVSAEARALAASWSKDTDGVSAKFNVGPASVVRLLDLSGIKVNDDGTVDTAAIESKLEELSRTEPGLVGSTSTKKTPKQDPSQGGGSTGDGPSVARGRSLFEERRRGGRKAATT